MIPLKIAILWHQHQPYYKINNEYKLPWVRLHGIKDYLDLPALLFNYPEIKQTFNIVPSMILQLEDYSENEVNEKILRLTQKKASQLNQDDKEEILKSFFTCNLENMILPYDRYKELYLLAKDSAVNDFSESDWLDLQIWYNLTWFGPLSRERVELKYLFSKKRQFTEEDKLLMLKVQKEILSEILPTMKRLSELEQIEVSVSPMYHPILPLICNTDSALESMPGIKLPTPSFAFPDDADKHLKDAVDFYKTKFGQMPVGLWPSEGAVSDESLNLVAKNGIKWIATDELIMMESLNNSVNRLERFFPRRFETKYGELNIFFRDHFLSDLIGFRYSSMEADKAAKDFIDRLMYVRWEISEHFGEDSLRYAVVPIILDGENCWEFYRDNGRPFLEKLFELLTEQTELKTVTFSAAVENKSAEYLKPINHVRAGSWINADFKIWIGQKEHVRAWEALRDARLSIEAAKSKISDVQINQAMNEILTAEGSDWFWWYSDSHQAPNKHDFDIMFRELLKNAYKFLDTEYPSSLDRPFGMINANEILTQAAKQISPAVNKLIESQWEDAGLYNTALAMNAMHASGEILSAVYFGNNDDNIYFRFELNRNLSDGESIEIQIIEPFELTIATKENILSENSRPVSICKVPRKKAKSLRVIITSRTKNSIINYPRSGSISINLI